MSKKSKVGMAAYIIVTVAVALLIMLFIGIVVLRG